MSCHLAAASGGSTFYHDKKSEASASLLGCYGFVKHWVRNGAKIPGLEQGHGPG